MILFSSFFFFCCCCSTSTRSEEEGKADDNLRDHVSQDGEKASFWCGGRRRRERKTTEDEHQGHRLEGRGGKIGKRVCSNALFSWWTMTKFSSRRCCLASRGNQRWWTKINARQKTIQSNRVQPRCCNCFFSPRAMGGSGKLTRRNDINNVWWIFDEISGDQYWQKSASPWRKSWARLQRICSMLMICSLRMKLSFSMDFLLVLWRTSLHPFSTLKGIRWEIVQRQRSN